jgi:protein-tyrosine-phosphatase
LFVCYGNIYRSALAEAWARKLMLESEIASAGFSEIEGRTTPSPFQSIATEIGVDLSSARSKRVSRADVDRAQLILVADLKNLDELLHQFPEAAHKATLLGFFLPTRRMSIRDPIDLPGSEARREARAVTTAVEGLAAWVRGSGSPIGA